jgi:hypothetical protein
MLATLVWRAYAGATLWDFSPKPSLKIKQKWDFSPKVLAIVLSHWHDVSRTKVCGSKVVWWCGRCF